MQSPTRFLGAVGLRRWATILCVAALAWPLHTAQSVEPRHPDWSRSANIYEVNLRQYTAGGTFREFEQHLPRLKDLGVDILWLMPIHPIGEKNRKGTLGSYYSVRDYLAVNSEYGTLDEFKALVRKIHAAGMHVILDWAANHSAWDNPLAEIHPDWYTRDSSGSFAPPVPDWHDVIDFDYSSPGLRRYMLDAMAFWVRETDIDGFRCDVSGMVPMDFWDAARTELERIKPVFVLAEDESPACHASAFDMTYSWDFHRLMNGVAKGVRTASDVRAHLQRERTEYAPDAYRMRFTSNHDENSWNGTEYERLGDAAEVMAVLSATVPGMPLIYSGQEAGPSKRLAFFERDPIAWQEHRMAHVYSVLLDLKRRNRALWNGTAGGEIAYVPTNRDSTVLGFLRAKEDDRVLTILNLSPRAQDVVLQSDTASGEYLDVFTGKRVELKADQHFTLAPWGYRVLADP